MMAVDAQIPIPVLEYLVAENSFTCYGLVKNENQKKYFVMIEWVQIVAPVAMFWISAGFLYLRKNNCPRTGTLFDTQNWGLLLGPLAITIIFLIQVIGPKLFWNFRGNPLAVTLLWMTEIGFFVGVLFFFKAGKEHFFAKLGFFPDQMLFRFVSGLRWISGFYLFYALFGYVLLSGVTVDEFSQFILRYDSKETNQIVRSMSFFDSSWGSISLLIPFFYFIIYGSIYQEVVFRGFLYGPIRKKIGPFFGIIMTALLFTFVHYGLTISSFIDIFLHGILFAFLYEKTQSLIPSIFVHIFSNMGPASGYFFKEKISFEAVQSTGRWGMLVFSVIFVFAVLLYQWMIKNGNTLKLPSSLVLGQTQGNK
ncbi:MAG: CPBP family intramembrane metalloprotease [Nitrospirae bacterium]|nr:CPBP family intramembrane metalloprotease [Candidatus Manganitrophaceae bacterium]